MNRKDFRPSNRSSSISPKDRAIIQKLPKSKEVLIHGRKTDKYVKYKQKGKTIKLTFSKEIKSDEKATIKAKYKGHVATPKERNKNHYLSSDSIVYDKKYKNRYKKFDSNFPKGKDKQTYEEKENEKKHYEKLDKQREKKRSLIIDKPNKESKPNKEKEKTIKKQIEQRKENYGDKPNLDIDKKDEKVLGNYYMVEKKPYFINGSKKTWLGGEIFTKSFDSKVEANNYLKDNPKVTGKILTRKEYAHVRAKEIKSDNDRGQY